MSYWTSVGEIAWAAPQVVAHRLALTATGRPPTAAARREQRRMVAEKGEAFTEGGPRRLDRLSGPVHVPGSG